MGTNTYSTNFDFENPYVQQQPKSSSNGNQLWANAKNDPRLGQMSSSLGKGLSNVRNNLGNTLGNGPRNSPAQQTNSQQQSNQPQQQNSQQQPNAQGYTATTAPYGVDQSNPGVGEQFWNQNQSLWFGGPQQDWNQTGAPSNSPQGGNQSSFGGPGQGSQFWNQVQGSFNQAGKSLEPEFDKAYDRGRDNAVGAANQQAAARGAYGSSAALNNVGNVINDFEANRGKAHTDFMLANRESGLNALNSYGNLAFGAGKEGLNTLNSAFNNSLAAQGARDSRVQGQFNNLFSQQQAITPWAQGQYSDMFGRDENAFGGAQDAALGRAQQNQNYATQARSNSENGLTSGASAVFGGIQAANSMGRGGGGGASRGYSPPPQYGPQAYPGYNAR